MSFCALLHNVRLTHTDFNPLPAAACHCLLGPSLCAVFMERQQAAVMHAGATYITQECAEAELTVQDTQHCSADRES